MSVSQFAFPQACRIKKRRDFLKVREEGRKFASTHFLLSFVNSESVCRLGIVAPRKADKLSVGRNRTKRLIREVFRLYMPRFKIPVDVVIVMRKASADLSFEEVQRQILGLFNRAKLLARQ